MDFINRAGSISSSVLAQAERTLGETSIDLYGWHPPALRRSLVTRVLRPRSKADHWARNWVFLRGMAPDLQAPSITVLRERFSDPDEARRVLRWLGDASEQWPSDLSESAFNPATPVSVTFLATVCHYADRFGALPLLFRETKPGSVGRRVRSVLSKYVRVISTAR